MFSLYQPSPYYPLPTAHYPVQPLSPRDKYLAAVAEAEAARASYLADEAARQEEEALERRLEELRMRRSSTGLLQPYGPDLRARHLLRRQIEAEEYRKQEEERIRRRIPEQERARLARVLEEERLRIRLEEQEHMRKEAARSRVRQQQTIVRSPRPYIWNDANAFEQHACSRRHSPSSSGLASKFDHPSSARKADSRLHHDHFPAGFFEDLVGQASPPKTQTAARHDEPSKAVDVQDVLSRLFGIPAAKPQDEVCEHAPAFIFSLIMLSQNAQVPCCSRPSARPAGVVPQDSKKPEASKAPFASSPASTPELDADAVADLASQFLGTSVDPEQVKNAIDLFSAFSSRTSGSSSSSGGLNDLLSGLLGISKEFGSSSSGAAPSSSSTAAAGSSPAAASGSSLKFVDPIATVKEQFGSRVNREDEQEIRDTMRAIMLSLQDQDEALKDMTGASSSAANSSTNTNKSAANYADASQGSDVGKGKGRASPEPTRTPTSKDVLASLDTVRNIEAAFSALSGDFAWPSALDFSPASSRATSLERLPLPSDTSSSTSTSSPLAKLAYTSRNQPVRFYEQALSALLAQLDAVESWGSEDVRTARREAVGRVEHALEEVEGEIEGRWGVWMKRERGREAVKVVEAEKAVEREVPKTEGEAEMTVHAENESVMKAEDDKEPRSEEVDPSEVSSVADS
ncbi:hypothetical protein BD626DRAFT_485458, partial [Schizophyllum amplum]